MNEDVARLAEAVQHPTLKRILALWEGKRGGRRWPSRADFDPTEMVYALGDISLFDVHENPRRFWCRLDGTRQVELFGVDCSRRYLDECFDEDYYAVAQQSFSRTVDEGQPQHYSREIPYGGRLIRYEVLMLPLSSTSAKVDQMMVVLTPFWA
ncbi:PAS domain-containing protein [Dongia sp.]|uniref:PAS domain-containing protein n=1 Tax=Dongia sp. TaxID=1977262 RepID=UPI0035B02A22